MPVLIGYIVGKVTAQWVLIWDRALRSLSHRRSPSVPSGRRTSVPRGQSTLSAWLVVALALARLVLWIGVAIGAIGTVLAGALWLIVPGPPFVHAFLLSLALAILCYLARSASVALDARLRGSSRYAF